MKEKDDELAQQPPSRGGEGKGGTAASFAFSAAFFFTFDSSNLIVHIIPRDLQEASSRHIHICNQLLEEAMFALFGTSWPFLRVFDVLLGAGFQQSGSHSVSGVVEETKFFRAF